MTRAPGGVEDHYAVLHFGDALSVDHALGLGGERAVDGDNIRNLIEGLQIHEFQMVVFQ